MPIRGPYRHESDLTYSWLVILRSNLYAGLAFVLSTLQVCFLPLPPTSSHYVFLVYKLIDDNGENG